MDQVATQTSAYAVIAALESEAAGVEQDEALVDGVEVRTLSFCACCALRSPLVSSTGR